MVFPDVEKIEFVMFGLNLVEPNALITDGLLGILSIYLGLKISRLPIDNAFTKRWKWFFLVFGLSTFLGGIGHTFIHYLGIAGKTPTWIFGLLAAYFIETAMISVHPNRKLALRLTKISAWKLALMMVLLSLILLLAKNSHKISLSILLVIINTLVGVFFSAGILGRHYYKIGLSDHFKLFVTGVLIILPSSAIFLLNLNLHSLFDKNDLSHLLLATGIIFFYQGVVRINKEGIS